MAKQEVRKVSVAVVGVAKRCRKEAFHLLDLGRHPVDVDPKAMAKLARETVEAAAFKSVRKVHLHIDWAEYEADTGTGFSSLLYSPFDERNVKVNLLDPTGTYNAEAFA